MVHLCIINIFIIYMFIYSILLLKIHIATYTSKMLSVISFKIKILTANLPHKLKVFTK